MRLTNCVLYQSCCQKKERETKHYKLLQLCCCGSPLKAGTRAAPRSALPPAQTRLWSWLVICGGFASPAVIGEAFPEQHGDLLKRPPLCQQAVLSQRSHPSQTWKTLTEICAHDVLLCARGVKVPLGPSEVTLLCRNCAMKSQQCYVNAM